jgi:hypothetical protein
MTKKSSSSSNVRTSMTGMTTLQVLLCLFVVALLQPQDGVVVMAMSKNIRFASPLQSLTIPDPELFAENEKDNKNTVVEAVVDDAEKNDEDFLLLRSASRRILDTPRTKFLPKFLTGLTAENQIREEIAVGKVKISDSYYDNDDTFDVSGNDWVGKTKTAETKRKRREDQVVEDAYDTAIASFEQQEQQRLNSKKMKKTTTNSNKYQYVGVVGINNKDNKKMKKKMNNSPISWYARPKPNNSNWSVRLLHVNKDVIIKDLFDQGKIDIFAKYTNTGPQQRQQSSNASGEDGRTANQSSQAPVVTTKYEARERSWK